MNEEKIIELAGKCISNARSASLIKLFDRNPWLVDREIPVQLGMDKLSPVMHHPFVACAKFGLAGPMYVLLQNDIKPDVLLSAFTEAHPNIAIASLLLMQKNFPVNILGERIDLIMASDAPGFPVTKMILDYGVKVSAKKKPDFGGTLARLITGSDEQFRGIAGSQRNLLMLMSMLVKNGYDINAGDPLRYLAGARPKSAANIESFIYGGATLPDKYDETLTSNGFDAQDISRIMAASMKMAMSKAINEAKERGVNACDHEEQEEKRVNSGREMAI